MSAVANKVADRTLKRERVREERKKKRGGERVSATMSSTIDSLNLRLMLMADSSQTRFWKVEGHFLNTRRWLARSLIYRP